MKKQIILIVAFLSMFGVLFAQTAHDITPNYAGVTGRVSDSSGNPLIGASVSVKGTSHGSFTGVDGKFTLSNVPKDAILHVSYMGYVSTDIPVNSSSLAIVLKEEVKKIDEIVVVGYGTSKRKDVTGAISSVSGDDIRATSPTTIDQALQGKVAGMMVQQISGQPGGDVAMQVRGITSFGGGKPLYVLDGVQIEDIASISANNGSTQLGSNPLAGINPSEIESIDVLKDASSTAIYGAKGTNGVIIITTKRGKVAAPKISYDYYTGFQQIAKKLPVMDLREYATFTNERNAAIGWGWDVRPEFANPQYLGKGTDWQDELFRNAPMSSHTLSVSGGDTRTQYFLSGTYFHQEGIALGSDFTRMSVRLNLDNKTTDWLKIGTSIQLVNIDENLNSSNSNVIRDALSQTPNVPVRNSDGSWGGQYNNAGWIAQTVNPAAMAKINKADGNRKQLFSNLYAEVTFAKGLVLRNEVAANYSMANEDRFNPSYVLGTVTNLTNSAANISSQNLYTSISNYLTFTRSFANKFNLNAMIGHEAILNKSSNASAYRSHFPSNNVQVVSAGDATTATNSGSQGQSAREAYFGRLNFTINDKYLLTGNIREDGDAKFSINNKWVWSYSGAFAWKLNNEQFLKNVKAVNELKLRIGYGLTNNPAGRDYAYASTLTTVATGLTGIAQYQTNIGNPDLKWEQTKTANLGLDGTFFDWRINFSVDFYDRRTDKLGMQVSLPMFSGTAMVWSPGTLDAPWANVGSMDNKGFDFRVSTTNIKGKSFTWKTDFTFSRNVNKVLKLNADGAPIIGYPASKTIVGGSLGQFYGYQVLGVYATPTDFLGDPDRGIKPAARPVDSNGNMYPVGTTGGSIWYGDIKFRDINGDGVIDSKDQTFLGSPFPKWQLGLNNTFSYKNFDLNIFFTASYGNKVYNQMRVSGEDPRQSTGNLKAIMNYAKLGLVDPNGPSTTTSGDITDPANLAAINNVYVINPGTKIQGLRNDDTNGNNRFSDRYLEDGSFLRCKTISLGYTFPEKLLHTIHINYLRVYANVSNAFLITKYKGMDPEIGSWNPLSAGVDYGYYPQPRVFTFGLNVSLNK